MAKLSLEGIISLSHQILKDGKTNIHNVELYQEDFEGIVMLTVEEAKEAIADYIDVVAEVVRQRNKPEIKIKHPKSILLLMDRIEQVEGVK